MYEALSEAFPPDTQFLVGDAKSGADAILRDMLDPSGGAELLNHYEHVVTVFEADWNVWGKRAGILRNLNALDYPAHHVVAFWDGRSPGTKHVIGEARKRELPLDCYVRPRRA
jgi:hypothetical protein